MSSQSLEKLINDKKQGQSPWAPEIFNLTESANSAALAQLFASSAVRQVVDDYAEQLKEWFQVANPALVYSPDFAGAFKDYIFGLEKEAPLWRQGRWVYYPWLATVVHLLEPEAFQMVRTARNRNLIDAKEQAVF